MIILTIALINDHTNLFFPLFWIITTSRWLGKTSLSWNLGLKIEYWKSTSLLPNFTKSFLGLACLPHIVFTWTIHIWCRTPASSEPTLSSSPHSKHRSPGKDQIKETPSEIEVTLTHEPHVHCLHCLTCIHWLHHYTLHTIIMLSLSKVLCKNGAMGKTV